MAKNPSQQFIDKPKVISNSVNPDSLLRIVPNREHVKLLSSWLEIISMQNFSIDPQLIDDVKWILTKWNGEAHYNSVPTLIYQVWEFYLITNTFADQMGAELFEWFIQIPDICFPVFYRVISEKGAAWFDDFSTPDRIETREYIIVKSFGETIEFLKGSLGNDIYRWQWRNFTNYLNNRHNLSNTFVNFLIQQSPVQMRKNGVSAHLGSSKGRNSVMPDEAENRIMIAIDWQENNSYLSINPNRVSLGLDLAFSPKQINAKLENNLKRMFLNPSHDPLLNISLEPK